MTEKVAEKVKPDEEMAGKDLPGVCPKCGSKTAFGYGLAGGGFGLYVACLNEACDFFSKRQSEETER